MFKTWKKQVNIPFVCNIFILVHQHKLSPLNIIYSATLCMAVLANVRVYIQFYMWLVKPSPNTTYKAQHTSMLTTGFHITILLCLFHFTFFVPNFVVSNWQQLVFSHRCNSRADSGEAKVESHASSETQPNLAALLFDTMHIQPGSQPHQCVGGNTVHLATWAECTASSPTQESLVCDETRISLPARPSLTRTALGQLCAAPWASRARPAAWTRTQNLWWHSQHCDAVPQTTAPPRRTKFIFFKDKIKVKSLDKTLAGMKMAMNDQFPTEKKQNGPKFCTQSSRRID